MKEIRVLFLSKFNLPILIRPTNLPELIDIILNRFCNMYAFKATLRVPLSNRCSLWLSCHVTWPKTKVSRSHDLGVLLCCCEVRLPALIWNGPVRFFCMDSGKGLWKKKNKRLCTPFFALGFSSPSVRSSVSVCFHRAEWRSSDLSVNS